VCDVRYGKEGRTPILPTFQTRLILLPWRMKQQFLSKLWKWRV